MIDSSYGENRTVTGNTQLFFTLENDDKFDQSTVWARMRAVYSEEKKITFKIQYRYQLKIIEKRSFIEIFHSVDDHSTKQYTDSNGNNC
jgi:hypothetical protein